MWLVSAGVLVTVLFLCTGQLVPISVASTLDHIVERDGTSTAQLIAMGYLGGMIAAFTPLRLLLRYFVTVVHELGHAFMAGLLLARPKSIYIHPSSSGLATWEIPPNWGRFRASLVAAAGYPAPSLASLAAVNAVQQGRTIAWSIFSVGVLSLAVLFLIRNLWGFLWTAGVIVGSYFAYQQVPVEFAGALVACVAGFLTVNSIQFSWIQFKLARHARGSGIDAEAIEQYLRIPSSVVSMGHLALTVCIGYFATRLAIESVWRDMYNWISEIY